MNNLNLAFKNSNVSPLNGGGVFRKVLQLKIVLKVIIFSRRIVFKQKLGVVDTTSWTYDSIHKRWVNYGCLKIDDFKNKLFDKSEFKIIFKTNEKIYKLI